MAARGLLASGRPAWKSLCSGGKEAHWRVQATDAARPHHSLEADSTTSPYLSLLVPNTRHRAQTASRPLLECPLFLPQLSWLGLHGDS